MDQVVSPFPTLLTEYWPTVINAIVQTSPATVAFCHWSHSNLGEKKQPSLCSLTTHQETHLISPACPASPWRARAPWTWGCRAESTPSPHQRSLRGLAWAAHARTCGRRCADMAGWAGGWRAPCRWGRSAPSRCSWSAPVHRREKSKQEPPIHKLHVDVTQTAVSFWRTEGGTTQLPVTLRNNKPLL